MEHRISSLGSDGGWPASGQDVAMALSFAASPWGLNRDDATVVSHSAGGYLAMWAASHGESCDSPYGSRPMSDLAASAAREDVCAPEAREMMAMGAPAHVTPGAVETLVVQERRTRSSTWRTAGG